MKSSLYVCFLFMLWVISALSLCQTVLSLYLGDGTCACVSIGVSLTATIVGINKTEP